MKKYIIERSIPGVHTMSERDLAAAATKSNRALAKLAPRVQWLESFVAEDKTFCVYLAEDEAAIQEHSQLSTFPANRVTEIAGLIDPTTANV
jgi:hypothetical protein